MFWQYKLLIRLKSELNIFRNGAPPSDDWFLLKRLVAGQKKGASKGVPNPVMAVHSAVVCSNICRVSTTYNLTEDKLVQTFRKAPKNHIYGKNEQKMSFLKKTSNRIKETLLGKQKDSQPETPKKQLQRQNSSKYIGKTDIILANRYSNGDTVEWHARCMMYPLNLCFLAVSSGLITRLEYQIWRKVTFNSGRTMYVGRSERT